MQLGLPGGEAVVEADVEVIPLEAREQALPNLSHQLPVPCCSGTVSS